MLPINDLERISEIERGIEERHAVALFLIKPSDEGAKAFFEAVNYYHHRAGRYCSLYVLGCSSGPMPGRPDSKPVPATVDGEPWYYSDECFIDTVDALERRLTHWHYLGTPEMIILQNALGKRGGLSFSPYYDIDIQYGLDKGYIDDFSRFMERFIRACKSKADARSALGAAEKLTIRPREIFLEAVKECKKLPAPVRKVIGDKAFFRSSKG